MIRKSIIAVLAFPVMGGIAGGLTSCSNSPLDDIPVLEQRTLCEVNVTCKGLDISTTRTRATPSEAGITHLSLKAFNTDGSEAATVTQTSALAGTEFNNLKVQLPAGTYTFVVVAHSATADDVACATIASANEATLPEGIIPTLYTHVEEITINNVNNQSVTLDMGSRINAILHLTSADVVPEGVSKIAVEINPTGTYVGNNALAKCNPSTGLFIGNPNYKRAVAVTSGQTIDATFNLLLPEDSQSYTMNVKALDADGKTISDYSRTIDNVPFQRAYTTNANGTYFRYVNSSSLTFDTTSENKDFAY